MIVRKLLVVLLVSLLSEPVAVAQRKKPFRIGSISIEGNTILAEEELLSSLRFVQTGDVYEDHVFEADVHINLLRRYWESGYLGASFTLVRRFDRKPEGAEGEPQVRLRIAIEEGERLRCREVRFKGVRLFRPSRLERLKRGLIGQFANIGKIENLAELLERIYHHFGYLDATVLPTWQITPALGSLEVELEIEEGGQYLVHRISFVGNSKTSDSELRKHLRADEQRMFNLVEFQRSLQKLNRLGLVQWITEADWELSKRPDDFEVVLLIRVRER